jgi:hypothetical protein
MRTRSVARSRRRFRVAAIALAAASLLCVPAAAVERTLQNDSFGGTGPVICITGQSFAEGEIAAARLTPAPTDYPFELLSVLILACPNGAQADLVVKIWEDDGSSPQPGDLRYEEIFTLYGSDVALNEIDLDPFDLVFTEGSLRVGIEYFFGAAPTGIATDIGGHVEPQPNFIYAIPPSDWVPADTLGVNGDWIIRAVIDANEAAPVFADGFESGDTGAWSAAVP